MQSWLYGLRGLGWQLELDTPRRLNEMLGDPMAQIPAVHIAGTNGKGSLVRMIGAILRESGWRVGLYTSPHLFHLAQRVEVQGRPIKPQTLAKALDTVRKAGGQISSPRHPSFFECITAAAFLAFRDLGVQVAVVETGLGGRYDATRVLPWVLANVFGPISLEHTDRLGNSVRKIAGEKAALLRAGVPGVVGPQCAEAQKVFSQTAERNGTPLISYGRDFRVLRSQISMRGTRLTACFSAGLGLPRQMDLFTPMVGRHQAQNAAVSAVAASVALRAMAQEPTRTAIRSGLQKAWLPGRIQITPGRPIHIWDTACNPGAFEALVSAIRELFGSRKLVLCAGFLKDKDIRKSAKILSVLSRQVVLTEPPVKGRALSALLSAKVFAHMGYETRAVEDPLEALKTARRMAGPGGLVLVTGSLFLVGHILDGDTSHRARIR